MTTEQLEKDIIQLQAELNQLKEIILVYAGDKEFLENLDNVTPEDLELKLMECDKAVETSPMFSDSSLYHLCIQLGMTPNDNASEELQVRNYLKYLARTNHKLSYYYDLFLKMQENGNATPILSVNNSPTV